MLFFTNWPNCVLKRRSDLIRTKDEDIAEWIKVTVEVVDRIILSIKKITGNKSFINFCTNILKSILQKNFYRCMLKKINPPMNNEIKRIKKILVWRWEYFLIFKKEFLKRNFQIWLINNWYLNQYVYVLYLYTYRLWKKN